MKNLYLLLLCLVALHANAQFSFHQDCSTAMPLCNGRYMFPFGFDGAGDTSELRNGSTCLTYGEQNSSWFRLTFDSPGQLAFAIEPLGADDYDFAVFNITGLSCSAIQDSLPPVVRCNYAITNGQPTGINSLATDTSAGLNGQPFLLSIPVDSGDVIMLLITSSSSFTSGFTLDFAGTTANMVADEPLTIVESFTAICENSLYTELFFSQPIDSNSIASDFSDFVLYDNLGNNLNIQQLFMDSAANRITIFCQRPAYTIDSIYIVSQMGTDGTTVKALCSAQQTPADTVTHRYLFNQMGTPGFTVSNIGRRHSFQANVANVAFVDWYYNGSFFVRKQASEPFVANLDAGETYTICMVAELGCNKDSSCQTIIYTGLEEHGNMASWSIYPNPANTIVDIVLPQEGSISITDVYGNMVYNTNGNNAYAIPTDAWANGIYLVIVAIDDSTYRSRIVISH